MACCETILTGDELCEQSRNWLDSTQRVLGTTSLSTWLEACADEVGLRFVRELRR